MRSAVNPGIQSEFTNWFGFLWLEWDPDGHSDRWDQEKGDRMTPNR